MAIARCYVAIPISEPRDPADFGQFSVINHNPPYISLMHSFIIPTIHHPIIHHPHHTSPPPYIIPTIHHPHHTSPPPYIISTVHHPHHTSPTSYITPTIHHPHHTSSPPYIIPTIHTPTIHHPHHTSSPPYITPTIHTPCHASSLTIPHLSPQCPRTFTMKHDLGYHVNTHNEKVMCETCSATYYTRTGLCLHHKMNICC